MSANAETALYANMRVDPTASSVQTRLVKGCRHVRFGSKADICTAIGHVRFTPNSDRESGFPQRVMSALGRHSDASNSHRTSPVGSMRR